MDTTSSRSDCFPAGLLVLVVDDDPTWLKILEKMLKKCNYGVTTCNLAREALSLLRERKDGYDIVISDVNMPDMDGFKLLEHVGLEMDLPVIMMSVDGETSRVMKGVQHGACDYLLKPIRMKELRNIWQHVFRKRIHEVRDIEGHEILEEISMTTRSGAELSDEAYVYGGDLISGRKRKDADNKHEDRVCSDPSSVKKARVVWTVDLHQKFVKAVNQIGFEKVGPKKILDLMGVPWLTRENVASHLQKYRLYLTRLQKENELKAAFCGTIPEPTGKVCLQSSFNPNEAAKQQNLPANEGQEILVHNDEPKICERNESEGLSKSTNASGISFNHSFGSSLCSNVKSESKLQAQYSWNSEISSLELKQEKKAEFNPEDRFDQLPLPIHPNQLASRRVSDKQMLGFSYNKNNEAVCEVDSFAALFSVQPERHLTDRHPSSTWNTKKQNQKQDLFDDLGSSEGNVVVGTGSTTSVQPERRLTDRDPSLTWNTKKQNQKQDLFDDLGSSQGNAVVGTGSTTYLRLWDEVFSEYPSQFEFCSPNIESLDYTNQEIIADFMPHLCESLMFDSEQPSEPVDYPIIDQGLFIA